MIERLKRSKFIFKIFYYIKPVLGLFEKKIKGNENKIINDSLISNIKFDIVGNNNFIHFKKGSRIFKLNVFVRGNNHTVIIGENCIIKKGEIWIEDQNCSLTIGDHTTIEDVHFGITEPNSKIEIGLDCMFSSGIKLITGDSHSIINLENNQRINYADNILIGDHVWIGADVLILKGSEVNKDSVIASRSIVTKKTKNTNVVLMGSPAKILKENITWDRERVYI